MRGEAHGVVRVLDYQDSAYARLYVERLQRIAAAAGNSSTQPLVARALAEAARLLALWMTYEDVIRVADLKSRRSRVARIRDEARVREGEILEIVEYLKPGVDEVAATLPRALGARLRDWATHNGKLESLNRGMHLPSTRIHGYLMRLLAWLRPMRRDRCAFTKQQSIERWLAALERMLAASPAFAAALAELPRCSRATATRSARPRQLRADLRHAGRARARPSGLAAALRGAARSDRGGAG